MLVQLGGASQCVDRFETLLETKGVSIPRHRSTGADMLPLWYILKQLREGFSGTPENLRRDYTAGAAVHDLAAKVLAVKDHADFDMLVPHLAMLMEGAVHLTEEPPAYADTYNKLIELYWACLLIKNGVKVDLDHPIHSPGRQSRRDRVRR